MLPFGTFAAVVKGKTTFDVDGTKGGLPTRRDGGPARYESVPIERHGLGWRFRIFLYTVRCAIVAVDIYSESCVITFGQDGLLPAQVRGEILPFWSYLSAQVRQRESCRSYSQGNGEGVKMAPRPIPLSVR